VWSSIGTPHAALTPNASASKLTPLARSISTVVDAAARRRGQGHRQDRRRGGAEQSVGTHGRAPSPRLVGGEVG
jgi:hypothetical protein